MIPFQNGHKATRSDRALDGVKVMGLEPQRGQQFPPDLLGAIGADLQPDGLSLAPIVQLGLHRHPHIGDLLLVDVEFAVAGDAEGPPGLHLGDTEETGQIGSDEIGQENRVPLTVRAGQPHQVGQHARHLDDGQTGGSRITAIRSANPRDEVQRLVEQLRERMRGIHRQRSQDRINLLLIIGRQPLPVGLVQHSRFEEVKTLGLQRRSQIARPAPVGIPNQGADTLGHHPQALAGREAIRCPTAAFRLDLLLQSGHPNLEELIQIGMGDAEKLDAFEQGDGGIQRLVQDSLIEFEPGQFAIEETGRDRPGRRRRNLGRGFRGFTSSRALLTGHETCREPP